MCSMYLCQKKRNLLCVLFREFHVVNLIYVSKMCYIFICIKPVFFPVKKSMFAQVMGQVLFVGFIRINAFWKTHVRQKFLNQCFLETSKPCEKMLLGSMLSEKIKSYQRSYDLCV